MWFSKNLLNKTSKPKRPNSPKKLSQIELNYCSQDLQITLLKQKILTFKSNTVYFYRVSKLNTLQCYQAVAHSSNDYYSFITMAIQDLKKKKTKNKRKKKTKKQYHQSDFQAFLDTYFQKNKPSFPEKSPCSYVFLTTTALHTYYVFK